MIEKTSDKMSKIPMKKKALRSLDAQTQKCKCEQ